jgi:VanZ family protein
MVDELIQAVMPSRGFEVTDVILNLLATALVLMLMHHRYSQRVKDVKTIRDLRHVTSIIHAWLPLVMFIGVLIIVANVILTNKNTLFIINHYLMALQPKVAHGTICLWVGKIRDYSHILIYAIFMVLVFRAVRITSKRSFLWCTSVSGMVALGFGIIDELAQGMIMGRSSSVTDWLIDIIGVGVGSIVLLAYKKHNAKSVTRRTGNIYSGL